MIPEIERHPDQLVPSGTRHFPMGLALFLTCLVAITLPLAIAVGSIVQWLGRNTTQLLWDGDFAIIELYTLQATRGLQLTGPYSRFGWHHPGPSYFYLLAPLYQLTGHNSVSLELSALIIALVALAGMLTVAYFAHSPGVFALTAVLLPVFVTTLGVAYFANPWNPLVTVVPFALALVVWAAWSSGKTAMLPVAVGISSFLVQTHISYLPLVSVACVSALLITNTPSIRDRLGLPRAARPGQTRWLVATLLVAAVMWYPTVLEQLVDSPGNLTQLVELYLTSAHQTHGLIESYVLLAQQILGPALGLLGVAGVAPGATSGVAIVAIAAAAQQVLLHLALLDAVRRRLGFRAALCLIASVEFWAAWWATTHIDGAFYSYLVAWAAGLGLVQWIALGSVLGPTIVDRMRPRQQWIKVSGVVVGIAIVVDCLRVSVPQSLLLPTLSPESSARELSLASHVRDYLSTQSDYPALVEVDPDVWSDAAAVVLQLSKDGIHVWVDPAFVFMFGPSFAARGPMQTTVFITTPSGSLPDKSRWERLAQDSTDAIYGHLDPVFAIVRPGSEWAHVAYLAGTELLFTDVTLDRARAQPGETTIADVHGIAAVDLTTHYMAVARLVDWNGKVVAEGSVPVNQLDRPPDQHRGDPLVCQIPLLLPAGAPRGIYRAEVSFFTIPEWAALPMTRIDGQKLGPMPAGEILIAPAEYQPTTQTTPPVALNDGFGDSLDLVGRSVPNVSPSNVELDLFWRAKQATAVNYTMFVQILDSQGKLVAQSDGFPWNGGYPTSSWSVSQTVRDTYRLALPSQLAPGTYSLIAGVYRLETMQRLPVVSANGTSMGNFVPLTQIEVSRT